MKSNITMTKIVLDFALYERFKGQSIALPTYSVDREKFNKIPRREFRAAVTCDRSTDAQGLYWGWLIPVAAQHDFSEKCGIKIEVLERIREFFKDEEQVCHYLLKYLLLPMEIETLPDGRKVDRVATTCYDKMDGNEFSQYLNDAIDLVAASIGVTVSQLKLIKV